MPDTTKEDDDSGFMGLTVVLARLNETTPDPLMTTPATATITEKRMRAGNVNPNVGRAHVTSHISAAMRRPNTRGGTFNSRTCLASNSTTLTRY